MKKIIELLKKVLTKEIILYLVFGVLTTIVSLGAYYLSVHTFLDPNNAFQLQIANIISWIVGVTFAYITNRKFVFESTTDNKLKEVSKFVSARIATLIMDMVFMFVGVTVLHFNDNIIKLLSQVMVVVANYVFSKIFVFRNKDV